MCFAVQGVLHARHCLFTNLNMCWRIAVAWKETSLEVEQAAHLLVHPNP